MIPSASTIFLSSQAEVEDIPNILKKIVAKTARDNTSESSNNKSLRIAVGHESKDDTLDNVLCFPTVMAVLVWLYRKFGLQKNEREIIINEEDQLVVLQLCLAEVNRQETGDFDTDMSDVIIANKALIGQRLGLECVESITVEVSELYTNFLRDSNTIDFMHVVNSLKEELPKNEELQNILKTCTVVSFYTPSGNIEKAAFKFLCDDRTILKTHLELPLDGSEECHIASQSCTLDDINELAIDVNVNNSFSITEQYLEQVFRSYMQLLVNSRSELALARVFNVPDRELSHEAFTALKREAKTKNMPMFQTASSYIMRLRLGGKGYAPDPNSAVNTHVKGFGEFVDFVHKIQTVIEEEPEPGKAVQKVINMIKMVIVRSKTNTLRTSSVEAVANHLKELVPQCLAFTSTAFGSSPQRPDSNGGSVLGRKALRILRQIIDRKVAQPMKKKNGDILSDVVTSQKTPIRLPSLFSQFKSPEILECSPESKLEQSLSERLAAKVKKVEKKQAIPRYQSSYDWLRQDDLSRDEDVMFFKQQQQLLLQEKPTIAFDSDCKTKDTSTVKAKKVLESIHDQENIIQSQTIVLSDKNTCGQNKPKTNHSTKRALDNGEMGLKKKQKISGKCQGKMTKKSAKPIPKGQLQLTKFFR